MQLMRVGAFERNSFDQNDSPSDIFLPVLVSLERKIITFAFTIRRKLQNETNRSVFGKYLFALVAQAESIENL